MTEICESCQQSRSTVVRAVEVLRLHGYLTIEREKGQSNRYRIVFEQDTSVTGVLDQCHQSTGVVSPEYRGSVIRVPVEGETTDVSNIYNTSLCTSLDKEKPKDLKANTKAATAVVTSSTEMTPPDIQNPEIAMKAKALIEHVSEDHYLSLIRQWQALYAPVLKEALEDVILRGKPVSPVWIRKRLVAKMSEMLAKPEAATAIDLSQHREFEQRLRQVEEMRKDGANEDDVREYLRNSQKNYPLKDATLQERKEWVLICEA
jgi:hypothetical protein